MPCLPNSLIHVQTLTGLRQKKKRKKEKKQDPIYFTPLLAFHFCDWRQRAYQLQNY